MIDDSHISQSVSPDLLAEESSTIRTDSFHAALSVIVSPCEVASLEGLIAGTTWTMLVALRRGRGREEAGMDMVDSMSGASWHRSTVRL